jgi:hypothetical protein
MLFFVSLVFSCCDMPVNIFFQFFPKNRKLLSRELQKVQMVSLETQSYISDTSDRNNPDLTYSTMDLGIQ